MESMKFVVLSLLLAIGLTAEMDVPKPPSMAKREIVRPSIAPPGKQIDLYENGKFTLYIPANWKATSRVSLTVHFHGAAWFAIDEHLRRGLEEPLLTVSPGEGSSIYQRSFQDSEAWPMMLSHVLAELEVPQDAVIDRVDVTSFSAGYGAVRELLKQELPQKQIRRIILADSMYASFTTAEDKTPLKSQIEPYMEFAKAAMRGEKGFVVTYSQVPTETYANSAACGRELVKQLGRNLKEPALSKAVLERDYPDYPLLETFDEQGLHIWGYGGTDAQAHMTHPRHIADIWRAVWRD